MKIVEQVEAIVRIDEGVNHSTVSVKLNGEAAAVSFVYNNQDGHLVVRKSALIEAFKGLIDWMESKK